MPDLSLPPTRDTYGTRTVHALECGLRAVVTEVTDPQQIAAIWDWWRLRDGFEEQMTGETEVERLLRESEERQLRLVQRKRLAVLAALLLFCLAFWVVVISLIIRWLS